MPVKNQIAETNNVENKEKKKEKEKEKVDQKTLSVIQPWTPYPVASSESHHNPLFLKTSFSVAAKDATCSGPIMV